MRGLLLLLLVGCTTTNKSPLVRGPLADLLLRVDPRYDGLVNQTCGAFTGDKCTTWDVSEYKLSEPETNAILVKLKFICKINGERFGICGNGFCQKAYKRKKFLGIPTGWEQYTTKYYSMDKDKKFLVEAGTYCLSQAQETELEE